MKSFASLFLILFFLGGVCSISSHEKYYELDLNYSDKNLELNSYKIVFLNKQDENFGAWSGIVYDFDDNILDLAFFDISNEIFIEHINPETGQFDWNDIIYLDNINLKTHVPYYDNASRIEIYNNELKVALSFDVSMFSKTTKEIVIKEDNIKNVADDKKIEDEQNGDDKIIRGAEDNKIKKDALDYWQIFAIILIILIIILIKSVFFAKQKNIVKN